MNSSPTFRLNAKASPPDPRDYLLNVTSLASSRLVDLSKDCTSVKNQGALGSCTAFAGVALIEQFLRSNGINIADDLLSEQFLYYNTRVLIEKTAPNDDSGAYLRSVMMAIQKYGVCLEGKCPYVTRQFATRPTAAAYSDGMKYQAVSYASIPTTRPVEALSMMKKVLSAGQSVVGGMLFYDNYINDNRGLIPAPTSTSEPVGGHAVLFVGYDDDRQVFKFKNSWGTGWGDRGYGYLPYAYLLTGNMFDLWTLSAQELNNQVIRQRVIAIPPAVRVSSLRQVSSTILDVLSRDLKDKLERGVKIDSQPTLAYVKEMIPEEHTPNLLDEDVKRIVMQVQTVWTAMRQLQETLGM